MTGTLTAGDLVVTFAADRYSKGDIVSYRIPSGPGKGDIVVHRIIGGDATGFVTQGDANPSPDPWHPTNADILGRLALRVPDVGQIFALGHAPPVFGSLWAVVAFILVFGAAPWGANRWVYSKAMALDHWPLAGSENPKWITQTLYRSTGRGLGLREVQVWSGRNQAWEDLLAFRDESGKAVWFGGECLDFGDPVLVETTQAEAESLIARPEGGMFDPLARIR
jgi:hypothetical protein